MKRLLLVFFSCCISSAFGQKLNRYEMYSDHFDIEGYTKQYERAFDSIGIITQKKQYHALTISLYGIMCYDEYIRSGDTYYLKQVENQYQYFCDTSKLDILFEGKGIGLPYHFPFHDLKPPWYSGLTQGIAVSFLLRYASLKNDPLAFEKAKKVAYPLLVPVENGGTLSKTPEGYLWIEEYPNTKRSKNVLNGFINGIVGLKEYITFFPEDTLAQRIHSEVYAAFKNTINSYDTPKNWSSYDRNNKSISVYYLRIQLTQLDHLYSIYRDPFLRDQMAIWSRMMVGKKDREFKFYKYPNYSYGGAIAATPRTSEFDFDFGDTLILSTKSNSGITVFAGRGKAIKLNNQNKFSSKKELVIVPDHSIHSFRIELSSNKKCEAIFYYTDTTQEEVAFNTLLKFQEFTREKEVDSIRILKRGLFNKRIDLDEFAYYDYRSYTLPMFGSLNLLGVIEMKAGKSYKIESEKMGVEGAKLFYRFSATPESVSTTNYYWHQNIPLNRGVFTPEKDGYYEFFVSFPIHSNKIVLRNVRISEK